jgi:membrane peptidoglycan carboxypeptidase
MIEYGNEKRKTPLRVAGTMVRLLLAIALSGLLAAALLMPVVGGAGLVARAAATKFLDTQCDVTITPAEQTTTVLAADGKTVLATFFDQNRQDIPLTQVPKPVQQALIATEDRRFYQHHGVDMRGILRAALHNGSGGGTQGGSTLTMQLVKQERYYQATTDAQRAAAVRQDLPRKMQDAQCALDLERRYSKAQILDDYLNLAFFGENSYGIQAAALTYFDVLASKLTVPQGALLVGLVRSPTTDDPFVNPEAARKRRDEVLANMVETGDLSAADAARYQAEPVRLATTKPPVRGGCANANAAVANVGFFCDYVVSWLKSTGGLTDQQLRTGGLTIVTTLDPAMQNSGQQAVWSAGLDPASPTALVMPSVDPHTGDVQTMLTSRHYGTDTSKGETELPLFTDGYAGAGSTYKYFTTLAALQLGMQTNFTLTTGNDGYTVRNCPLNPLSHDVAYTTHNVGNHPPTLPLSDALPQSVNTYFVGMEDQFFDCNLQPIVQTALNLGMTTLNQPQASGSTTSIAQAVVQQHQAGFTLGFSPTSVLQLTAAYGAVANDGVFCPAIPVTSITGPGGKAVAFHKSECSKQFDPQVARTMVKLMTADTTSYEGTAGSYFRGWYAGGGSVVASKTGTDNDDPNGPDQGNGNSALWFVGVTPKLVSAAALVNPTSPKAQVTGLPAAVSTRGGDVFGAYASTFWLDAYGAQLHAQPWAWPDPAAIPGAVAVPDTTGKSADAARAVLAASGFGVNVAPIFCGSPQPPGTVGYFEPHLAVPGSAITLCRSNGKRPDGYTSSGPIPAPRAGNPPAAPAPPPSQPSNAPPPRGPTASPRPPKPRPPHP